MARVKNRRNISFKPLYKHFVPKKIKQNDKTTLLADEVEALYLADIVGDYQEECAKKMHVSRSTYARILKDARLKLTIALFNGHEIILEDAIEDIFVAICTSKEDIFSNSHPKNRYIQIFKLSKNEITCVKTMQNPLFNTYNKPAIILPKLLLNEGVNIFLSSFVGEGLKGALMLKGISVLVQKDFNLEKIRENFLY